ncbi:MAG: heparinase II/III family protein, partial [Planktomarina sp.]
TARLLNRWRVRRAIWAKPPTGFTRAPEPRTIGEMARGRQLVAGNVQFTGEIMQVTSGSVWRHRPPSPGFEGELHGFGWLDDLAALGDGDARVLAQAWVVSWLRRYGGGQGPGWSADLTGRRLIRLINNAMFLLPNLDKSDADRFYRSLAHQTLFLSKHWSKSLPGLPRFEAVCGLVSSGLALAGMDAHVDAGLQALGAECENQIDENGGLITRNPEELMEVFSLLTWVKQSLEYEDQAVPVPVLAAIQRIAPALRTLRHADGTLARFHGGGKGTEFRLDQVLAASGVRATAPQDQAMGFVRLSSGATTIIVDAAAPPSGAASLGAHASTNAFELASGRQRLIVSCGSGVSFGSEWRMAGRATPSHSTLGINGVSSSRFGPGGRGSLRMLSDVPDTVLMQKNSAIDGSRLQTTHNGYQQTHGLVHARTLDLTIDGKGLVGEDELYAPDAADVAKFEKLLSADGPGIGYAVRFHLHPDVDARLDMGGAAVSLELASGDIWVFRHDGSAQLSLEPSVYLEQGRLHPRAADQIVLSGTAHEITTRLKWSLAKATENQVRGGAS